MIWIIFPVIVQKVLQILLQLSVNHWNRDFTICTWKRLSPGYKTFYPVLVPELEKFFARKKDMMYDGNIFNLKKWHLYVIQVNLILDIWFVIGITIFVILLILARGLLSRLEDIGDPQFKFISICFWQICTLLFGKIIYTICLHSVCCGLFGRFE